MAKKKIQIENISTITVEDLVKWFVDNAVIPDEDKQPLSKVGNKNPDGTFRPLNTCPEQTLDDVVDVQPTGPRVPFQVGIPMVDDDGNRVDELR